MTHVYFAIPVSPRRSDEQWDRLNALLAMTLRSVANQTSDAYTAIVCGHEMPPCIAEFDSDHVQFIQATFDKAQTIEEGRRDKNRKRRSIAVEVRNRGGGYYMFLDADDLVHCDLVATIVADDNHVGYIITQGYALDYNNRRLAPIPGAWRKPFNGVCGSSGIIYLEPDDLPSTVHPEPMDKNIRFALIRNHTMFENYSEISGYSLAEMDFPAGIYTVNNGINLSNVLVRTEERQQQLVDGIAKRAIFGSELSDAIRDFGLQEIENEA